MDIWTVKDYSKAVKKSIFNVFFILSASQNDLNTYFEQYLTKKFTRLLKFCDVKKINHDQSCQKLF